MSDAIKQETIVDVDSLEATQNLAIRLAGQLEGLNASLKNAREMYKNLFANDDRLAELDHEVEKASRAVKTRKLEIQQTKEAVDLKLKIADLSEDVKMVKESLSTHLLNIFQLTGSKDLDLPDGDTVEYNVRAWMKGRVGHKMPKNKVSPGQTSVFDQLEGVESVTITHADGSTSTIGKLSEEGES